MSIQNVETAPTQPETKPHTRRWPWVAAGILVVLVLGAIGVTTGYQEAIRQRLNQASSQVAMEATTQYQLGIQDLAAHRYDHARQRFEYVIKIDPNFPGASEKLSEAMLAASFTATPTVAPTPTLTPTPDTRGVEELFNQARQFLSEKKWTEAIDTLDSLRKSDVKYRAIEVDGMYYLALRYRGAQKILQEGRLQEGLYDLALAERFGPLDGDANGYRVWANLYLTGASFWQVDWAKAAFYFGQVAPYYPGLRDSTGMTSTERFRLATAGMGDDFMKKDDPCSAEKKYQAALDIGSDPKVQEKLRIASESCQATNMPPTVTPAAFTPTPSATGEAPTGAAPTAAVPTETPTPPSP
ncbi:MAG: hypothetical protein PHQ40_01475 [Anaerolineaceae bacterium]|nr:hypothetical protein [Anaerolineaceae bacterium]